MEQEPINILLIEDNPGDVRLIREMLKEAKPYRFELTVADRLSIGLDQLATDGLKLVLLDLGLPDSQGLDTFFQVYARVPHLPIVILTGLADEELALKALEQGAQNYVVKGQMDGNLLARAMRHAIERKHAETALRESEEKYRTLVETTDTGYLILDSQGKVSDANQEYIRLSGHMSLEEILGRSVIEWTAEHDRERNAAEVIKCLQRGYVRGLEIDYIDKQGRITPIEINATVITTGQSSQIVSLCRDITERKDAADHLLAAASKWRTTFDAIGDAVTLLDSDCKILQCNQAMVDLAGKPFSEIIGATCWQVMHGAAAPIDGCPLVRMKQSRQRQTLTLPQGDRWLHVMVDPVLNEAGEVAGAVHIITDITKIKRTEEALRQTHDYLENLIRYANAPIIVWDPEFRITRFNHAFEHLTGYTAHEVIGQKLHLLFPEASREESLGKIASTSSGERWESVEIPILRKDGDIRIALWNSANILDRGGTTLVATIAQGQDITDRKQAEEALQVSHRFLEIANRHHEMSPLLQEFLEEVQKTMQCHAVGVRILDAAGNIPYQAYRGFSREFCELESPLSVKTDECMCINVIRGATDPQLPFYTPGGSCYMNATTRLATVSQEEKGRTRNACNEFGYESVALVPIRLGDHILGLIHVADPKENMVPLERVEELEGIAQQLGAAMQRVSSMAALEKLHRQHELILNSAGEGILGLDLNGNHTFVNPAAARMLGYEVGELISRHSHSTWHHTRPNGSPYPTEECPIYEAFRKGGIQHVTDELFWRKDGTSFVAEAISTPIKDNGAILGAVVTFWDVTQRKQGEEALQESYKELARTLQGTVAALAATIEIRDPYTAGHQGRVTQLACAIAREMGLPENQVEALRIIGHLHDIGKISVPAEILSKPGKIGDYEYSIIKGHAEAGYQVIKDIGFPSIVAEAILQHHERLDGSGYPQSLGGEGILLEARILAVADVVEAMASHRPYRPALGIDQALEEITRNQGTLYDPLVVEACVKLFREQGFELK